MKLTDETIEAMRDHARVEAPREMCGLIVSGKFYPCRNMYPGVGRFILNPEDLANAELEGNVEAVVHSHVNIAPEPSEADRVMMERWGLPWVIVNHPTGEVRIHLPNGYKAPLEGREFCHGVNDCFTLIRDYYERELGMLLPDFERADEWWLKGENLYVANFASAGFRQVFSEPQKHDIIIMRVSSEVPNHGAVYLGDGVILHHVMNRLSRREVYKGYWERHTALVVRHETL